MNDLSRLFHFKPLSKEKWEAFHQENYLGRIDLQEVDAKTVLLEWDMQQGTDFLEPFLYTLHPSIERVMVPYDLAAYGFQKVGSLWGLDLRKAARGILVTPEKKVLLIQMKTDRHEEPFWLTPGGKIETEETEEEALSREVFEEVGFRIETKPRFLRYDAWVNKKRHFPLFLCNAYYLIEMEEKEVLPAFLQEDEKEAFLGYHWWLPQEIATTKERVYPVWLKQLLPFSKAL